MFNEPVPDDDPVLTAARRGVSLVYKNKTLLSRFDPVSQGEKAAAAVEQQERTLYFCPSPLLGYGLACFLSGLQSGSALLCVETDEKLLALSKNFIEKPILDHPRCILTGEHGGQELCGLVRDKWGSRGFRRVVRVQLNGGRQLDGETYGKLEDALRNNIALEWSNALTLTKLGRRYARNAIRNLAFLAAPDGGIRDFFFTDPALVLGAGPSLDGFLDRLAPRLKQYSEKTKPFRILCADTCIPVLLERGIRPDLAVILESQHWNAADFVGARDSGIACAADLSAYPLTVKLLGGPCLFFLTPWTRLRLLERIRGCFNPPVFPPLGSVGLSAVELARRLTNGPVIAAGIDFSFLIDMTHARGSPAHRSSLYRHNRLRSLISGAAFGEGVFTAVSKSGLPVRSNPAMRTYRDLFEETFSGGKAVYELEGGTGLPLGTQTISESGALDTLFSGVCRTAQPEKTARTGTSADVAAFIRDEIAALKELRNILTGGQEDKTEKLSALLDELDYLWAHFPDCAEKGRPPVSDTGFLKRTRTEIEPFLRLWENLERAVQSTG